MGDPGLRGDSKATSLKEGEDLWCGDQQGGTWVGMWVGVRSRVGAGGRKVVGEGSGLCPEGSGDPWGLLVGQSQVLLWKTSSSPLSLECGQETRGWGDTASGQPRDVAEGPGKAGSDRWARPGEGARAGWQLWGSSLGPRVRGRSQSRAPS